jgi:hypothetical protein
MAYRPSREVVAVRDPSISAELAASTLTLGITAPEASLTWPEIVLCAQAAGESRTTITIALTKHTSSPKLRMATSLRDC